MMTEDRFMELYNKLPKKVRKKFTKEQVAEAAREAVQRGTTFEAALNLFKNKDVTPGSTVTPKTTVRY